MGIYSLAKGKSSEKFAASFLKANGYKIITRNYRSKFGEVDIVARDGDVLCFIEVKFRKNTDYGEPEDFVNYSKQKKIVKTALFYMSEKNEVDVNIRFDIVSLLPDKKDKYQAKLIKNGFEADYYG